MPGEKTQSSERRYDSEPVYSRESKSIKAEREEYDACDVESTRIPEHLSPVGKKRNCEKGERMIHLIPDAGLKDLEHFRRYMRAKRVSRESSQCHAEE